MLEGLHNLKDITIFTSDMGMEFPVVKSMESLSRIISMEIFMAISSMPSGLKILSLAEMPTLQAWKLGKKSPHLAQLQTLIFRGLHSSTIPHQLPREEFGDR